MSQTTLTFNDEELTTTAMLRLKEIRSMIDIPRPILEDMLSGGTESVSGGERLTVAWKFQRHSRTTQLSNGYEPIELFGRPLGKFGHDDWFYAVRPVLISEKEETLNRGEHAFMSILDRRLEDVDMGLREEFEEQIVRGGVAAMSDLNTLNGTDFSTGFLEELAVGSQVNTVHNVSKAIGQTSDHFQNQVTDFAGSFSANGLQGMYDIHTRIRVKGAKKGMGYLSVAGMNNLKSVIQDQERYAPGNLDAGTPALIYQGMAHKVTEVLPNAGTDTTADPWTLLIVDWDAVKFVYQEGKLFNMTPFETIPGHRVRAAFMEIFGQLRITSFSGCAVGFDGETLT